jgi:hypothetical protein
MSLALILNLILCAAVVTAVVTPLAWAIRASQSDSQHLGRRLRVERAPRPAAPAAAHRARRSAIRNGYAPYAS